MKRAHALHGLACAVSLALCLVYPASGRATLLVPVGGTNAGALLASRETGSFAVLGGGLIAGSLHVRFSKAPPLNLLLASGLIPIAVPASLCNPSPQPSLTSTGPNQ